MSTPRTSKACQTCHRRRVKCDASEVGLPCSRCKNGNIPDCRFIVSRRGTYDRKKNKHSLEDTTGTTGSKDDSSVSWSKVVDQMFCDTQASKELNGTSMTYLGESLLLPLMIGNELKGGARFLRMHQEASSHHTDYITQQELALMEARGAFTRCTPKYERELISIFLNQLYPMYPVVNRKEFLEEYNSDRTPWILLHAICFISSMYAPNSLVQSCGFTDYAQARSSFYTRAKVLFDLNYEKNKLVLIQAQILFSFNVGRPDDIWYTHTWIGIAVSTAETLGMHRSTTLCNVPERDDSLFRRLWWILFNRDASIAALFGRTPRVNYDHCDKELPRLDDFEDESEDRSPSYYQIELSKLSLILREITTYRINTTPGQMRIDYLCQRLATWKENLPEMFQWVDDEKMSSNVFALCLEMIYHHHLIYVHLQSPRLFASSNDEPNSQHVIETATKRITSIGHYIVTKSLVSNMPHECYPAIFAAEVVLYSRIKYGDSNRADLARAQLDICQMVLREIGHFWDSAWWIMHLFEVLISKLHDTSKTGFQSFCEDIPNRNPIDNGLNDFIAFVSAWQGEQPEPLLEASELNSLFHNLLE